VNPSHPQPPDFLYLCVNPIRLKKNTLILLSLFSFALLFRAYGSEWRPYGFDDRVVIKVPQQPTVMDTLGQRMLFVDCDYGRLTVQGLDDRKDIYTKDEIFEYYDKFLIDYSRNAKVEILSKQYDTLRSYYCLAFTSRFKDSNMLSISKLVWINNNAYLFQYLYDESNHVKALTEAQIFFNTIQFSDIGAHQFSMNKVYTAIGVGMLIFILSGIAGVLIIGIFYLRRKLKAKRT
jgi:hypothetical protein